MTSWGREGDVEAMRNMLTQYPKGLVACMSDSYTGSAHQEIRCSSSGYPGFLRSSRCAVTPHSR
eukprot:541262-Pyramimonas_sp.AAC.1